MRFKFYLRGCGLGILLATIVLAIWFSTHKTVMTDDDVVARAEELGMVFADDNAMAADTEEETEAAESLGEAGEGARFATAQDAQDADDAESGDIEDADADSDEPDEDTDAPDGEDAETAEENAGDDEEPDASIADENAADGDVTVVSFTIKGGQYCRVISENLYEAGLVADAEEFRVFMQDNDYDNNIQVGTYELSTDMSYEDIAKIITTKTQ